MDPQQGPPQPDLLIGQTIGNYLVTQKLGEGGMGAVYLAEHPAIGKKVALKVLHSEFSTNQEVTARFFHEAKAVNDIGHPNIVDIVDFGIIQANQGREQLVYFIMEYLAGMTLSHLIRSEAPLAPERALTIGLQVADALSASHKCGIVHRDLKPDNIILVQRGRERDFVKLLDFGIAKLTGGSAMGSHRTRTGIVMGTPAYMSPEQCEGRDTVDLRTDVYALGIVLYEMLTGRVPFIGEGYGEILVQHLTQRPIAPSKYRMLPPHVEVVVMKALEKRADMRYPSMDELMHAMSDPVGYVEAHGGVGGFLHRQLLPSTGPVPASLRLTPAPVTPLPGTMIAPMPTPRPPAPTTLGSSTGQIQLGRSKVGYIAAAVVVVVAAVVLIVVVAGKKPTDVAGPGRDGSASAVAGNDPGTATVGSAGSASPETGHGSAAVATTSDTGSARGSAAVPTIPDTGSASGTTPTIPETGDTRDTGDSGSAARGSDGPASPGPGSSAGSRDHTIPRPTNVGIDVDSNPPNAKILVDGNDTGKTTPATISLPKGARVTITLKLKGYNATVFKAVEVKDNTLLKGDLVKPKGGGNPPPPGPGSAVHPPGPGSAARPPGPGTKYPDVPDRPRKPDDLMPP